MPNSNSELYVLHAWEENPIYIKCVQGEGGIKIANFKLVDDNGVINLSSATSVTFDGIKRDGSGCCINCKIVDAANGIIEFVEQTGITDIDGNVNGTINVVFPDGNIKFDGITLYVAPNNTTKLIEASQAFSAFVEALNKLALLTPEGTIALDDVLTNDGVNAVQGKVIKAAIDKKIDNSEGSVKRENIEINAVGSDEIDSGAIETIHLSSKSVTAEKLSDEVVNEINKKSDKTDSLAGYGILDAYTKNDIDSLLNKLGTKNYSFLFDTAGRIFSFTWDNAINEGSFAYQDDTQNGYYVWLGKNVNNVASGALQNVENIKKIWCENSEENVSFTTDYDSVAKSFGQNPLSEFYKLASIAKLHNEKANKSNSLSGYGIEDAYTKAEVDTALSGKIDNSDGAVKRENIENNAVSTDEIDSGAVETVNIADRAVTKEKLNDDVKDMLYMTSAQNWVNALVGTAKTGGFFFDSTGKKIVTDKYSGALISIKGGDKIKVSARTSSASPYLVAFYSDYTYVEGTAQGESYTFLEGYGIASTDYNDEEITVPVGAKYAGVNSYITGDTAIPLSVYKLADIVYDKPIKSAVKDKLNNSAGAVTTDNIANGAITELKLADDVRTKLQEVVNTLP